MTSPSSPHGTCAHLKVVGPWVARAEGVRAFSSLSMPAIVARSGTLRAPIGSSIAQVFLAAARALIEAAKKMEAR